MINEKLATDLERLMCDAYEKKVQVTEKSGKKHTALCELFTWRDDEVNGISSIALSDGTWLYEDQIESIEIIDDTVNKGDAE